MDETHAKIARNTRVYAKKQLTWLKRHHDTIWLAPENATTTAIEAIADRLN